MKFAMLGGSFNPVHNGHLRLARGICALGYDRVILVPAYQSPLKPSGQGESADFRVELLLAAIRGDRRLTVDLCEIRRQGVSYTIDTVYDLTARYTPEGKLGLVLGDDLLAAFSEWRGAEEIARVCDLIIARRLGEKPNFPYPHRDLANPIVKLASAEIRGAIAGGSRWRDSVPLEAARLIEAGGFYRNEGASPPSTLAPPAPPPSTPPPAPSVEDHAGVEGFVRRHLSQKRFIHSRAVALHCADLARRFGVSEGSAFLAGITHDICKDMDIETMRALALRDGRPLSLAEEAAPPLLHGRAAAVYIRETLDVQDEAVLEALRLHTTGSGTPGPLAQILYLCDKIETGRTSVDLELRRPVFGPEASLPLDELFARIKDATESWLRARGQFHV
jgi:nicotinate-nucleotide adenylyltransferase